MAACACFAQQVTSSPFRVAITSNVPHACAGAVPAAIIQHDAEGRLRSAGVTVSDIHNAQLTVDLDCVPVKPGAHDTALAVHQCLGLSELVSSNERKPILANTWRKCESYICGTAKCEAPVRIGLNALLDSFLGELRERTAPRVETASVVDAPTGATATERVVYYAVYLMICVMLLLYWQLRKRTC